MIPKTRLADTPTHQLAIVDYPIADLNPFHKNPRRGNVEVIAESLATLGQYRAVVVNLGTRTGRPNEVLAGNHTVQAAGLLGWPTVKAQFVDVDDAAAGKIVAVDNRAGDMGSYDEDVLAELLDSLPDLEGTGYDAADLDDLITGLDEGNDEPPAPSLGAPVIGYQLVFDDEPQQAKWYEFLRWLKREFPESDTLGERLATYIAERVL